METNLRKEQFSYAWLRAIASVAGFSADKPSVDDDSIDLIISSKQRNRPRLEVQVKCTELDDGEGETLPFALNLKNYHDLRATEVIVPRLLVVLRVPPALEQWATCTPNELILRHTAWWYNVCGQPDTTNASSVTLHIPRQQRLTPVTLAQIMQAIADNRDISL